MCGMGRSLGAVTALLRVALAVMVGGALALLVPSLVTTTVGAPSTVVLAAIAVAVTAVIALGHPVVVTRAHAFRHPGGEGTPCFLAERVVDPMHHPLRPRAPGPA